MKTSIIRISANVLKGIMEFRGTEKSLYALDCIGFSMDKSRGAAVRYHAADGHIGITGICGEIDGHRLPKQGVSLPPEIYSEETTLGDELALQIDHSGSVNDKQWNVRIKGEFQPRRQACPRIGGDPKEIRGNLGGKLRGYPADPAGMWAFRESHQGPVVYAGG